MLHQTILGELDEKDSDFWHDLDTDLPRPDLSQILKLILRVRNSYILRDKYDGDRIIFVS